LKFAETTVRATIKTKTLFSTGVWNATRSLSLLAVLTARSLRRRRGNRARVKSKRISEKGDVNDSLEWRPHPPGHLLMARRLFTLFLSLFVAGCASDIDARHQRLTGATLLPAQYRCAKFCALDYLHSTFRVPQHGLLIAHGAILTTYADWIVVDYDSRSLTRIKTEGGNNSNGQFQPRVVERSDRFLSLKEMATVQASADRIWSLPVRVPTKFTYHKVWNIYLLDGEAIRSEFGPGNPDGLGAELQDVLEGLWSGHQ
jgi:hypothetical protein